jgi:RNA recognition motif-containing protein
MVLDGHSGRSRGFAFVYYKNIDDATEVDSGLKLFIHKSCINLLSHSDLGGRGLRS